MNILFRCSTRAAEVAVLRSLWRFALVLLLLCLWFGAVHQSAGAHKLAVPLAQGSSQQGDTEKSSTATFAPVVVDHCPYLSPYDAAGLLQEPINDGAAIGNLIFGSLREDFDFSTRELQGLCGYTNATPVARDTLDRSQIHLLTDLPYPHAVAVARLPVEELMAAKGGTGKAAWYDFSLPVDLMGATNLFADNQEILKMFSDAEVFAFMQPSLFFMLSDSPGRKAYLIPTRAGNVNDAVVVEPYHELLWIWQPVDDGYFSLLIARTRLDFELVIARLGNTVSEEDALGYSRVILQQMRSNVDAQARQASNLPLAFGCDEITGDDAISVVGDVVVGDVVGQAMQTHQGVGCLFAVEEATVSLCNRSQGVYSPGCLVTAEDAADSTIFLRHFKSFGMLTGIITKRESQLWLTDLIGALAGSSNTVSLLTDLISALAGSSNTVSAKTVQKLRDLAAGDDLAKAMRQIAATPWQADRWQAASLPAVDADTLLVYATPVEGATHFYLFLPRPAGGLYFVAGVSSLRPDDLRPTLVNVAQKLIGAGQTATSVP